MPNLIPLAQGFKVTGAPQEVTELYIHSVDIAIAAKSSTAGMTVSICEVVNGKPSLSRVLPAAQAYLESQYITAIGTTATKDTTSFTKFTFPNPVNIKTNVEYALLIKPDGNNTDYKIFTATRGLADTVLGSTSSIPQPSGQITLTDFYKGVFGGDWTTVHNKYFQLVFNRYKFTRAGASVTFNSSNNDFFTVANLTSTSIRAGDVVFGGNASVLNTTQYGVIYYVHANNNTIYLENSTGNFGTGNTIQIFRANGEVNRTVAYANVNVGTRVSNGYIYSIDDLSYHVVSPRFQEVLPPGTGISYSYTGIVKSGANYLVNGTNPSVRNGTENSFNDTERVIPSYSNSKTALPAKSSISITAYLQSNNDYVTPMLDQSLSQAMVVTNHLDGVNANVYMEYFNTGQIATKYVSKPVVLATGQDAEDIKVYITAWRPPQTDLKVYAKFLSAQDSAPLTQKTWTLLTNDNPTVYSDAGDKTNLIEYSFSLQNTVNDPTLYLRGTGTITGNVNSTQISGSLESIFNTQLQPNKILYNSSNLVIGTISSITNSTALLLTSNSLVNTAGEIFNYADSVIPPQTNAFLNLTNLVQKSGTVAVSNTSALVTGTSTAFNTELAISNYISVNGEQKYIVSIANSTSMTVDSPFSVSNTGITYSQLLPNGLTYTDGNGTTYVKYKTFQIKMTMHSDNLVFTPHAHDLRAIALQS